MMDRPSLVGRSVRRGAPPVMLLQGAAIVWAYWPTLTSLARSWSHDSRYTHGFLVPGFAALLLWIRRPRQAGAEFRPSGWGIPLLAAGVALRMAGAYIDFEWLEAISLLPCLAGLWVLLGGRAALRWAGPAIAFLAFMMPLPFRLEQALGWPLQRLATITSTYLLQTLGLPALREGNIIVMHKSQIGVVEACSGLGMLVLFFAIATGVAMLARRPLIDRLVIVVSAIPIALIANITRITITGVLHETVGERVANLVFHDLAGWLMMPVALALLGLELWLMDWLLDEVKPTGRPALVLTKAVAAPRPRRGDRERVRHGAKRATPTRGGKATVISRRAGESSSASASTFHESS